MKSSMWSGGISNGCSSSTTVYCVWFMSDIVPVWTTPGVIGSNYIRPALARAFGIADCTAVECRGGRPARVLVMKVLSAPTGGCLMARGAVSLPVYWFLG